MEDSPRPAAARRVAGLKRRARLDGASQRRRLDKAALVAFYKATNGDGWKNNANWNSDKPIGEWHGVTTNDNGRVTSLSLSDNGLSGVLPPEIGYLTELTSFGIWTNAVTGPVPSEIGKLTKLGTLDLGQSRFTGSLPPEIGDLAALHTFYGDYSYLSGALPVEAAKIKPWLYDGDGNGQPDDTTREAQWAISVWSWPWFNNTRGLCIGLQPEINEWLKGEGYTGGHPTPFTNSTMKDSRCIILMETSPSHIIEPLSGSKDVEVTVTAKVNHVIGAEVSLPLNALGGNATSGSNADYEIVGTAPTAITIPADATQGSATYTIRVHSDDNHTERERIDFSGTNAKYTTILDANDNPTSVPTNYAYDYTRTKASLAIIDPYTISLSASPDAVEEAASGDRSVNISVKAAIDPAPSSEVTVTTTFGGDATSADYTAAASTITIPANSTEGTASVALTVKSNDDSDETNEDMDKLDINGSASVGGSAVAVNGTSVFLTEPLTNLGEISFGATSRGVAHWDYVIPGGKATDYDNDPVRANGMKFDYYEVRWMETAQKAVGAGWEGKSSKVFYNSDAASFQMPDLKLDTEYKTKLFVGITSGDKRYYVKSPTTTFKTPTIKELLHIARPIPKATNTGAVSWEPVEPLMGGQLDYTEVRWIETAQKAVGAGWEGKSSKVFYNSDASSHQMTNLKAGTEYKVKLVAGVTYGDVQHYGFSETLTFTTPSYREALGKADFSVRPTGTVHWSYDIQEWWLESRFDYYEVRWMKTDDKAVGAGWEGKSNHVFYSDRVSSFDIPNLEADTEYKAMLFVGVDVGGTQRYGQSGVETFTTPTESAGIEFSVSAGKAKWSDNRSNRATYGYYEVQWKDAAKSGWGERSGRTVFFYKGAFQIPGLQPGKQYMARLYAGQHPAETDAKNNHYSKEVTFRR